MHCLILSKTRAFLQWIKNKDKGAKIRSDSLFQDAFEFELAALAKFNAAKAGVEP